MNVCRDIAIVNKLGLHLRAAAQFVQLAHRYRCDVWASKDEKKVNGKSIMGMMTLVAVMGAIVRVECEGPDAVECMHALEKLAAGRFGEKE